MMTPLRRQTPRNATAGELGTCSLGLAVAGCREGLRAALTPVLLTIV